MSRPRVQVVLEASHGVGLGSLKESLACNGVWDPKEARFEKCFLPIISLLPGIVATVVIFLRVCRPLLRNRPVWLRPFVQEFDNKEEAFASHVKARLSSLLLVLLTISIIGLILEVISALYPFSNFAAILPAISWVCLSVAIRVSINAFAGHYRPPPDRGPSK